MATIGPRRVRGGGRGTLVAPLGSLIPRPLPPTWRGAKRDGWGRGPDSLSINRQVLHCLWRSPLHQTTRDCEKTEEPSNSFNKKKRWITAMIAWSLLFLWLINLHQEDKWNLKFIGLISFVYLMRLYFLWMTINSIIEYADTIASILVLSLQF